MERLLHVDSSIRSLEESRSRRLTARYAHAWRKAHPNGVVTYRDIAADPVPHMDAMTYSAIVVPPENRNAAQAAAWVPTAELAGEVVAADTIVLGIGLYNYGVPSSVKAWIDRIFIPGLTWDANGGLLSEKRLVLVLTSGGGYGEGTPRYGWDHREPWLRHAFQHLGISNVLVISAEFTLAKESPMMIPFDLGHAEDTSYAAAQAMIDAQFAPNRS